MNESTGKGITAEEQEHTAVLDPDIVPVEKVPSTGTERPESVSRESPCLISPWGTGTRTIREIPFFVRPPGRRAQKQGRNILSGR